VVDRRRATAALSGHAATGRLQTSGGRSLQQQPTEKSELLQEAPRPCCIDFSITTTAGWIDGWTGVHGEAEFQEATASAAAAG